MTAVDHDLLHPYEGAGIEISARLPQELPKVFLQQATEAIKSILSLEHGDQGENAKKLAQQIAQADFVGTLKDRYPEQYPTSFPRWVLQAREGEKLGVPQDVGVAMGVEYSRLVGVYGGHLESKNQGEYCYFTSNGAGLDGQYSELGAFKAYLLTSDPKQFEETLIELKEREVFPTATKLSHEAGRIVMYWEGRNIDEISARLSGTKLSALKQDSMRIIPGDDGQATVRTTVSADRALKTSIGNSFVQTSFNITSFLESYLRQCYFWYRNPQDPNRLSFIPSTIPPEELPNELVAEAKRIDVPIIFIPPRQISFL